MTEQLETTERLPTVAIIGRPNVGKSTLFNRIVGSRRSIVGDLPGITRDRIYGTAEWNERGFQIVDTGGIVPDDDAIIPTNIFKQARAAIDEASLLLFVVDVRAGISPLDEEIARQIRTLDKPVFIVANKSETARTANEAGEFHQFGFEDVFPVSAEHGLGMADLLDAMMEVLPEVPPPPKVQTEINVAIIGRPNTGKSSLVNKLLGEERVIVSPIAGTTRDAVDSVVPAKQEGLLPLRIIDTAGIRRKGKTELMEEKLSVVMARKHIERADVALLLIDAVEGVTHLDASIAGYAHDAGTSVIIVVNKWDLVEKDTYTAKVFEEKVRDQMKFLDYAPVIFLSAKSGQRVHKLHEMIAHANEARNMRIGTGQLNQFYRDFLEQPKATTGKSRLKVFYLTQASVAPPTFVLFTNARNGAKLHFSYDRYLINRLRETFDFYATPIRIQQRGRR
ncbi:MAG TPA: ribosome biogenesis GTPase Der [Blastocatellia bacterium]|nr:ribosome biogenesis GTPase Der [Blastocatellia bacterium]